MKKTVLSFVCAVLFSTAAFAQNNTLTEREKQDGWILMFNGENFDGWRQFNKPTMAPFWSIDQEAMRIAPMTERPPQVEGEPRLPSSCIIFDRKFENFEFSIDWMVGRGANSGIFFLVHEVPGQTIYAAAPEFQILDNWNAADNVRTSHLAGSLYGIIPALPQVANPHNMWNRSVIRMYNGHLTHTMNGVRVVETTFWTPEWDALFARSHFSSWASMQNGFARNGFIGLQDHRDFPVWFRNIKIREL
jgi:hypothetical protein